MWLNILLALASVLLGAAEPELPTGVQRALSTYGAADASARAALVRTLEAEQAKATKANRLDDALAIRALIEKTQGGELLPVPAKDDLLGDSTGKGRFVGRWIHDNGRPVMELKDDGTAIHLMMRWPGTWVIDKEVVVVTWSSGETDTLQPPDKNGVSKGLKNNGARWGQTKEAKK